jgi:hypothetical protein
MLALEVIDRWIILVGLALVIFGLFGVLSSVNFPGIAGLKQLRAFPALRVLYGIVTAAVVVVFVVLSVMLTNTLGGSAH